MIEEPQRTVPGTVMPKVPMGASTRELIVAFLTRGEAGRGAVAESLATAARVARLAAPPSGTRDAPALYGHLCAPCHGAAGRGDGPNAANLSVRPAPHADPAFMSRRSDDRLFDAIHAGGYPLGRNVAMPPYGETLSRSEVWALVRHLRVLCQCAGPAWSTDGEQRRDATRPR